MKKLTVEDIYYMQDAVVKWNETFSNMADDKSLIPTYENLVREEWGGENEYYNSYLAGDLVGRLDGIADLIFTGFMLGALTGKGYTEDDDLWLNRVLSDDHDLELEVYQTQVVIGGKSSANLSTQLVFLLAAESKYMDIRGGFDRVLESNYSKAIPSGSGIDVNLEIARIESEGRYGGVYVEPSGDFLVLRAKYDLKEGAEFPKGKIIKSSLFKEPCDLGEFIY